MTYDMRKIGPEKRKFYLRMALTFANGNPKFLDKDDDSFRKAVYEKAENWVEMTIIAIRTAPDNMIGQDEEAICKWINENIEKTLNERK